MKYRYVLGAALAMGAASLALADGASDLVAFLKKFEPKVQQAFAKEDAAFFEKISTPGFTYVDSAGNTQNKAQSMQGMKQMFAMSTNVKAKFTRGAVSAKGNTGTARYKGFFSMDVKGPDGKVAKMTMSTQTVETYRKSGNMWLVHQIKETAPSKMTMNGKPFDPAMMAPPPPPAPNKRGG